MSLLLLDVYGCLTTVKNQKDLMGIKKPVKRLSNYRVSFHDH
jgi:hypothetical protein